MNADQVRRYRPTGSSIPPQLHYIAPARGTHRRTVATSWSRRGHRCRPNLEALGVDDVLRLVPTALVADDAEEGLGRSEDFLSGGCGCGSTGWWTRWWTLWFLSQIEKGPSP